MIVKIKKRERDKRVLANNASTNRRCHINNQRQQHQHQQRWSCCVSPCQRHRGWSMTAAGRQVYSSASCAVPQLISGCVFSWWMTWAGRRQHRGGRGREDDEGEERERRPPSGWTQAYRPETHHPTRKPTGRWNATSPAAGCRLF